MKERLIFSFLIGFVVLGILIYSILLSANSVQDSILWQCYKANFETLKFTGDLSGEIDCMKFYEDEYYGKFSDKCSSFFFSSKLDCHTLCNIDCAYQNKKEGGRVCVC